MPYRLLVSGASLWVPLACPAPELYPREVIEPSIDGLAHAGAVIVCPASNLGLSWQINTPCGRAFPRRLIRVLPTSLLDIEDVIR